MYGFIRRAVWEGRAVAVAIPPTAQDSHAAAQLYFRKATTSFYKNSLGVDLKNLWRKSGS